MSFYSSEKVTEEEPALPVITAGFPFVSTIAFVFAFIFALCVSVGSCLNAVFKCYIFIQPST